jgi:hypothetical protein
MHRPNTPITRCTTAHAYEPPEIKALGSVEALTAMSIPKRDGPGDGLAVITAEGIIPITNAS